MEVYLNICQICELVFLFYEKGCRCGLEGSPRIIGGEDSVVTDICEYFLQNFSCI